ncbi:PD-(D/E)XK nuclease-like domain-containing protein [Chryseobacterium potabilaquae]|uniref:Putative exodeoxyribonuclease 8 PDDEXK-like domain-containing protein n=1 Tax=Chryseobacterium potabilaquae TaxID=2675057 RepID=A0A6N4X5Q6_9FLAO|nr:PD-(D/E)XK nuclease-like domain-containing protein [Chryseobacterium potabilaquae]CAA7195425.1 hypothetical protein CHRY9293_01624 [Chryseobacterium potabilaquae]
MNIENLKNSLPDLHQAEVSEKDFDTIDYTRPLNEYPTAEKISDFLLSKNTKNIHIYTEDLNVNGIAVQDSMEKYLAKDALQSSHFKKALISPLHLGFSLDDDKAELEKLQEKKDNLELGTFLHECILEPTKFSRVIVEPKSSLASREGVETLIKFWKATIEEQGFGINSQGEQIPVFQTFEEAKNHVNGLGLNLEKQDGLKAYYRSLVSLSGKAPVSEEHFLKIQILKKQYDRYGGGILKEILKHSKREISFYTEQDGVELKVRPDAIQFEENIGVNAIISIKSTACEDLRAFYYNAAKLDYDLSEGMYQEIVSKVTGRDFNTTIMIMLQTVEPYGIAVFVWSGEDIEMGKYKFRTGFQIAKECQKKKHYAGYESFAEEGNFGLIQMQLPLWNNKVLLPTHI